MCCPRLTLTLPNADPAVTPGAPTAVDTTTVPYAPNAYACVEDMVLRFGECEMADLSIKHCCPPGHTQWRNDAVIIRAINDASAEIDKYLARRFALPLKGCPARDEKGTIVGYCPHPLLTRIACTIARWWAFDEQKPESAVNQEFKHAMANLEQIAKGELGLVCPTGELPGTAIAPTPGAPDLPGYQFDCRRMNCCSLHGFAFRVGCAQCACCVRSNKPGGGGYGGFGGH